MSGLQQYLGHKQSYCNLEMLNNIDYIMPVYCIKYKGQLSPKTGTFGDMGRQVDSSQPSQFFPRKDTINVMPVYNMNYPVCLMIMVRTCSDLC